MDLVLVQDEERLFWSFPLRNTRRVSCQHYCTAVEKIVTRSVGIHSNKCNGKHSASTPCVYAVCNGKPPKGIIPGHLFTGYQWIQHGAKVDLLQLQNPADSKFKKVPNTMDNSTMYSNIQLVGSGPPPLAPMRSERADQKTQTAVKREPKMLGDGQSNTVKTEASEHLESPNRRRPVTVNGERAPFVSNVVINMKALINKKKTISDEELTSSSSIGSALGARDYSNVLLHSQSSVLREAEDAAITRHLQKKRVSKKDPLPLQYIQMMMHGQFDVVISVLEPLIPERDRPTFVPSKTRRDGHGEAVSVEMNGYRLLLATAYFYKKDVRAPLHYVSLIIRDSKERNSVYYEARKCMLSLSLSLSLYGALCVISHPLISVHIQCGASSTKRRVITRRRAMTLNMRRFTIITKRVGATPSMQPAVRMAVWTMDQTLNPVPTEDRHCSHTMRCHHELRGCRLGSFRFLKSIYRSFKWVLAI